ncbi:hypothetical protein J6590_035893 [Homalodisca vitripennis]|nr:hypothetical protein J6590_035893 [Homalodisca vitripennis]
MVESLQTTSAWNVSGGGNSGRLLSTCVSRHLVEMDRWTGEHSGYAVKAYYTNGESLVKTRHAFRRHFNKPRNRPVPLDNAIRSWINKLDQRLIDEVGVQKPFEHLQITLLFNRQCSEVHADLPNNMLYTLE